MRKLIIFSILCMVLCAGCQDMNKYSEESPVDVFEILWNDFDNHYPLFGDRGIDWDSLYSVYRPQVAEGISSDSLWKVCTAMLGHFKDNHVSISDTPNFKHFNSNTPSQAIISYLDVYANASLNGAYVKKVNNYLYSRKKDGIGYIYIGTFKEYLYPLEDLDILVESVRDCSAIIIDVRENGGGMSYYAFHLASWFTECDNLVHYTQSMTGAAHDAFGELVEHRNLVRADNLADKYIVVLTNVNTISAGERFVLCTKGFNSVVQIGATTAGSFCMTSMTRFLPNGWTYTYSAERFLTPDMVSPEGVGCIPDIYADNDYLNPDHPLTDLVVDAALEYLQTNFGLEWKY